MVELTFAYYQETYRGRLAEADFDANLPKAQDLVAGLFSRDPDEGDTGEAEAVARALCYAVDYEQVNETLASGLTSEHNDDYSYTRDKAILERSRSSLLSSVVRCLQQVGLYYPTMRVRRTPCYHC